MENWVNVPREKYCRLIKALQEIEQLSRGPAEWNPTFEQINKIATNAIGVKSDGQSES